MNYFKLLPILFIFPACQATPEIIPEETPQEPVFNAEEARAKYNYQQNFSAAENDTLLTELATYIYNMPSNAQWDTKFDPEFRNYYTENRINLELIYLHKADSNYYFYLVRDARDKMGPANRGVGGTFTMNDSLDVTELEELFNTRIFPKDQLVEIGFDFMEEIAVSGNANQFISDSVHVEWPDGALFYSKQKHEWRFVE